MGRKFNDIFHSRPRRLLFFLSNKKKLFPKQYAYVVYPPEGPRPPSPEAVHALARAERERDQKEKAAAAKK